MASPDAGTAGAASADASFGRRAYDRRGDSPSRRAAALAGDGDGEDDKPPGGADNADDKDKKEEGKGDAKDDAKGDGKGDRNGEGKGEGKGDDKEGEEGGDGKGDDGKGDDKKQSPLKNPKVRIALIVVVIVLLIVLIYLWIRHETYGKYQQTTNDAYIGADQVNIAARVAGWVTEVAVADNEQLAPGRLVARLDPREYAGKVEQSLGDVVQGEAAAAQADAQIHQQRAMISEKREQIAQYEAQMRQYRASERYYQSEVDRYRPLVATGAEPAEKLAQYISNRDQARAQVDSSRAQRDGARADVVYQQRQIPVYEAEKLAGVGKAQSARGTLDTNRTDLEQTTIVSPIEGRVADRQVRVGQYVQAGTKLLTVVPLRAQYLDANFKETQIGLMRVGQPATITVDALPGTTLSGTVASFTPGTGNRFALVPQNNATGNFTKIVQRVTVRIQLDDNQDMVRRVLVPGLSVEVSVDTRGAEDDAKEVKKEDKATRDQRKQERKDAIEQQKGKAASGAGGG